MKPYNLVYLHAHDAGRYIQPYGYPVQTPHLQAFAEQGMIFRQAFCANPTCSPSRACLLTGQYAHVNGMLGLAHRGFALKDNTQTLANFLQANGWATALSGVQHILPHGGDTTATGYQENLTDGKHAPLLTTEAAEAFLSREHGQPFFLDVGYFAPHRDGKGGFPTLLPTPNAHYVRPPAHLPDTPETRADFADYLASVATFDEQARRVLAAIDANGLTDSTLVIVTTDHGIAFPGMKCRLTDHGIGVMLLLRGPGGFTGGKLTDAMVSHLDIFPTVCDVLQLPAPERLQGKSLRPLADEPTIALHEEIFAEVNAHAAYEPMRAVRTDRWKYIRRLHDFAHPVQPNTDNGLTKRYLQRHDWPSRVMPEEELYDLLFDPMESVNLASDPAHAATLTGLRQRLDDWMARTEDPLRHGGQIDLSDKKVDPVDAVNPT